MRNLMRIIDFMPWGYALGLICIFFSSQARRLGDHAAGTIVIKERRDVSLPALERLANASSVYESVNPVGIPYPEARRLSPSDTGLIREVLERDRQHALDDQIVSQLAMAIATKLNVEPPAASACRAFLSSVVASYDAR